MFMEFIFFAGTLALGWVGIFVPIFVFIIPIYFFVVSHKEEAKIKGYTRRNLYLVSLFVLSSIVLLINHSSSGLALVALIPLIGLLLFIMMIWGVFELLILSHEVFGEKSK